MRAIIALKSDADVRKERWQFQICDLVYGRRCGRHFASSHRATTPGRSATLSLADDVRVVRLLDQNPHSPVSQWRTAQIRSRGSFISSAPAVKFVTTVTDWPDLLRHLGQGEFSCRRAHRS